VRLACRSSISGKAQNGCRASISWPPMRRLLEVRGYHNRGDPWKEERFLVTDASICHARLLWPAAARKTWMAGSARR